MQDYIELFWTTDKNPNAKHLRDSKARELRKLGYTVESKTVNFIDLARCIYYGLEATKEIEEKKEQKQTCLT